MSILTNKPEWDEEQRRVAERSLKHLERVNAQAEGDDGEGLSEAERLAARASPPPLRVDGEVVGSKVRETLSERQQAFIEGILQGWTQVKAYRQAYSAENMTPGSISSSAQKLMKLRKVQQAIKAGRERTVEAIAADPEKVRDHVMGSLVELSQTARQEGSRIKALELLGKTVGLFIDRQQTEDSTPDAAALKAALAHHLSAVQPVPVAAPPVPAPQHGAESGLTH